MKIDWDKLQVIDSRGTKKHGVSEYKKTVKELRDELKSRGLKYSGSKEELITRIKDDDNRIETAEADGMLKNLQGLKNRIQMVKDYEEEYLAPDEDIKFYEEDDYDNGQFI